MTQINRQSTAGSGETADAQRAREVRELRTAITSHMSDKSVGDDLAPMMAELLATLDAFVAADETSDLKPPAVPGVGEPPSLEREAAAMSSGAQKVRQFARGANDPETRGRLAEMSQVLEAHLARRHEVLARADKM